MLDEGTGRRTQDEVDVLAAWTTRAAHRYAERYIADAWRWLRRWRHADWTPETLRMWRAVTAGPVVPVWPLAALLAGVGWFLGVRQAEGRRVTPEEVAAGLRGLRLGSIEAPEASLAALWVPPDWGGEGPLRLPTPGGAASAGGGRNPPRGVRLTPHRRRAVLWAEGAAAERVTAWADAIRADLRWTVVQGMRDGTAERGLARRLRDRFGAWGADFERLAITEAAAAHAAGFLLGIPDGAWVAAALAPDACPSCRRLLLGKRFRVRRSADGADPWRDVWPGKSNAGRREPEWWPTIPVHPRCRCSWVMVASR